MQFLFFWKIVPYISFIKKVDFSIKSKHLQFLTNRWHYTQQLNLFGDIRRTQLFRVIDHSAKTQQTSNYVLFVITKMKRCKFFLIMLLKTTSGQEYYSVYQVQSPTKINLSKEDKDFQNYQSSLLWQIYFCKKYLHRKYVKVPGHRGLPHRDPEGRGTKKSLDLKIGKIPGKWKPYHLSTSSCERSLWTTTKHLGNCIFGSYFSAWFDIRIAEV